MKKTLLLSTAVALAASVSAQMPDNSICPDWTGTDLNGGTHNLYTYLDQGYTVFIDVSAAWCGPCWSYHNTHALRDVYDNYGPGTAEDKVMVFFIEGESQNTGAQLTGTSGSGALFSQGNWVAGTTYPIIDDASIGDLLQTGYFPTVYKVCPNRLITEIGQASASALWTSVDQCDKYIADSPADGSLLPNISNSITCIGSPVDLSIRLQNTGTSPLTSATIEAKRGTTVLGTQDWTGNLDTYEVATVNVTPFTPTSAANNIVFTVLSTDDEATNNTANGSVTAANTIMPGVEVTLELQTDQYPGETSWIMYDGDNNVLDESPNTPYAANSLNVVNWTLNDNECYRFEIFDAYGDGICCGFGNGFYKLKVNGNTVITGTSFGDDDVKPFKTSITAAVEENVLENGLSVFPNPTEGRLNVSLNLPSATKVGMTLTNILGAVVLQEVRAYSAGSQTVTLDLSSVAQGTYTLNILADGMTAARKVTITH